MVKYVILLHFYVSPKTHKKKKNIKIQYKKESSGTLLSWDFKQ